MGNSNTQQYQRNNLVQTIKLNSKQYEIQQQKEHDAPVTCCCFQKDVLKVENQNYNNNNQQSQQQQQQLTLQKKTYCQKINYYCCCNMFICCRARYENISLNQEHENDLLEKQEIGKCKKCYLGTKNCCSACRYCLSNIGAPFIYACDKCYECKVSCKQKCSACIGCWDDCNAGCQLCCGCSCAVVIHNLTNIEDKECDCTLENNNPCEIKDRTNPQLLELLSEFVLLDHLKHQYIGPCSLIQHKFSKELVLLKEFSFWSKQKLRHFIDPFVKRYYAFQHPNIIRLRKIIAGHSENLFFTDLTAYLFFDFTTTDLQQEIKVRKQDGIKFNESEILNLLEGCVSALSYFHSKGFWLNNLTSERIFINPEGFFKLTDPSLFNFQSFYEKIYNKRNILHKGLYLSPAQLKGIQLNLPKPMHNVYQTDVFVLGMIVLEACILETCEDAYDYVNGNIVQTQLDQLIKLASVNYSTGTIKILKQMLIIDENERPTSEQVLQYFKNNAPIHQKIKDIYQGYTYFDNKNHLDHLKHNNMDETGHMHATVNDLQRNQDAMFFGTIDPNLRGYNRNYMKGYEYDVEEIVLESDEDDIEQQLQKIDIKYAQQYAEKEKQYKQHLFEMKEKEKMDQKQLQDDQNLDRYLYLIEGDKEQENKQKQIEFQLHQKIHPLSYNDYLENTITNKHTFYQQQKLKEDQQKMVKSRQEQEIQLKFENIANKNKFEILEEYYDKSCYQGESLFGKRHGQGVYVFQDKSYYKGQWFNNKMNGIGMLYYSNNEIAYDGYFIENLFQGKGILYNEKKQIDTNFDGFTPTDLTNINKKWKKYEGDFYQNKWHGQGILYLSNGDIFEGEFFKGVPNGNGKYQISKTNQFFEGQWKHGAYSKK